MFWKIIPRRKIYFIKDEFGILLRNLFKKYENMWVSRFEKKFACFIGTKYAISTSSGREAMVLILKALNLSKGDEIIVPAYTLKDLVRIINSMGLVAVPADIDCRTFNISCEEIVKKITPRTKIILATHIFGVPCEIEKILEIARRHSIHVVEDCAHSVGSEINGRRTGSFGEAAFFSFDTIKPVNTYGGGIVTTNNEQLASRIRHQVFKRNKKVQLPVKKIIAAYLESILSSTIFLLPFLWLLASSWLGKKIYDFYRKIQQISAPKDSFTDFQAYIGLKKLSALSERIAKRNKLAGLFKARLNKKIVFQKIYNEALSNYYFLVIITSLEAKKIRKSLLLWGIDFGVESEIADDCAHFLGFKDCYNTESIYKHALQVPLYESLTKSDISYIADKLNHILG